MAAHTTVFGLKRDLFERLFTCCQTLAADEAGWVRRARKRSSVMPRIEEKIRRMGEEFKRREENRIFRKGRRLRRSSEDPEKNRGRGR